MSEHHYCQRQSLDMILDHFHPSLTITSYWLIYISMLSSHLFFSEKVDVFLRCFSIKILFAFHGSPTLVSQTSLSKQYQLTCITCFLLSDVLNCSFRSQYFPECVCRHLYYVLSIHDYVSHPYLKLQHLQNSWQFLTE